jgi:hypothetical protein
VPRPTLPDFGPALAALEGNDEGGEALAWLREPWSSHSPGWQA